MTPVMTCIKCPAGVRGAADFIGINPGEDLGQGLSERLIGQPGKMQEAGM